MKPLFVGQLQNAVELLYCHLCVFLIATNISLETYFKTYSTNVKYQIHTKNYK